LASPARAAELRRVSVGWPTWSLTLAQVADLELLMTGALAPLGGYMGRADHESCLAQGRLTDGTPWPAPLVLEVSAPFARSRRPGEQVVLQDAEGVALAAISVSDAWRGETPAGKEFWALGGTVEGIQLPDHYDFVEMRRSPASIREELDRRAWDTVVAFLPNDFVRQAEYEAAIRGIDSVGGHLLLLPLAVARAPDDALYFARMRALQALARRHGPDRLVHALVPWTGRATEAQSEPLLRLTVARNFGATHVLVAVDEGADYEPLARHAAQLGVTLVAVTVTARMPDGATSEADPATAPFRPAGRATHVGPHEIVARGQIVPHSITYPEVAEELRRAYPPRRAQGFTVFFTGLSGSGKSTVANALRVKLMERGGRRLTLLDGDLVRKNLSSELGFSREHRDLNIRRIGFVASEITKHGGIAICAPIAPYRSVRAEVRRTVEAAGGFCLVFVDTPLDVCAARDRKGLYAKARAGLIENFTGVSDPYEVPDDADVVVKTTEMSAGEAAAAIIRYLEAEGYLDPGSDDTKG
jgi:sulfate adenylyltransferase